MVKLVECLNMTHVVRAGMQHVCERLQQYDGGSCLSRVQHPHRSIATSAVSRDAREGHAAQVYTYGFISLPNFPSQTLHSSLSPHSLSSPPPFLCIILICFHLPHSPTVQILSTNSSYA